MLIEHLETELYRRGNAALNLERQQQRRYAQIIRSSATAGTKEAVELADLLEPLKLTGHDVRLDTEAWEKVQQLERFVGQLEPKHAAALREANRLHDGFVVARRGGEARHAEALELESQENDARAESQQAYEAAGGLREKITAIRREFPRPWTWFGGVEK